MVKSVSNQLASFIFTFIVTYHLIIDAINGFFSMQFSVSVPISILSKLLLFLIGGYLLLKRNNHYIFIVLIFVIVFIFPPVLRFILESEGRPFTEIAFALKYVLFVFCIILFNCNYDESERQRVIKKMLVVSCLAVSINVMLGYFGWGFYTYKATNTGFKGFFIAGNELSAVFIVVSTYILCELFISKRYLIYVVMSVFLMFISLSLGTKSTLIAIPFILITAPVVIYLFSGKLKWLPFYGLGAAGMVAGALSNYELFLNFDSIQRILHKVSKLDYLHVIFSGREMWAESILVYLQNNLSIQNILLGPGLHTVEKVLSGKALIESDLFDIFNMFGVIGLTSCLLISVFFVLYPVIKSSRPYAPHVFIANILLFTFAIITGHVWASGMLAISWAGLNSLIFIKCK